MHGGDPCPTKNASLQGRFSACLVVKTQSESVTFSSANLQLHALAFSVARWCISPMPFSFQIAHQRRSRFSSFHNFWHLTCFFFFFPTRDLLAIPRSPLLLLKAEIYNLKRSLASETQMLSWGVGVCEPQLSLFVDLVLVTAEVGGLWTGAQEVILRPKWVGGYDSSKTGDGV